jgi:hypothetical protein
MFVIGTGVLAMLAARPVPTRPVPTQPGQVNPHALPSVWPYVRGVGSYWTGGCIVAAGVVVSAVGIGLTKRDED